MALTPEPAPAETLDFIREIVAEDLRSGKRTATLEELQIEVRRARDVQMAENQEWLAALRFRPPVLPG